MPTKQMLTDVSRRRIMRCPDLAAATPHNSSCQKEVRSQEPSVLRPVVVTHLPWHEVGVVTAASEFAMQYSDRVLFASVSKAPSPRFLLRPTN